MVNRSEFLNLLNESDLVSKVIEVCHRSALRRFEYYQDSESVLSFSDFEQDFRRRAAFIRKHLADWLYHITDTLALEAWFASHGEPMCKSSLSQLINFIFVDRELGGPPLKDGRNEIWDAPTLRWAIRVVLPEIRVRGAVTLETVARRINVLPPNGFCHKRRKPLTGKHLQKLLKGHHIDWMQIKKDCKAHFDHKT